LLGVANVTLGQHQAAGLRIGIVVFSFLLAYLTYRFVEQPIRKSRKVKLSAFILTFCMACVGVMGLTIFSQNGIFGQTRKPLLMSSTGAEDCLAEFKAGRLCVMGNLEAKETILVYGDSQAEQLSGAVNELLGKRYKIVFAFFSSCFMGESQNLGLKTTPQCASIINSTKALRGQKLNAVIRAQQWHGYGIESTARVIEAVDDTIRAFDLAPQQIFMVGGVASVDIRCAKWNYYFGNERNLKQCADEQPSIQSVKSFIDMTKYLQVAENLHFVYPYEKLCDANGCHVIHEGVQYYGNENHLTREGAKLVVSDIAKILDAVPSQSTAVQH
jgi:hypothetical protein